MVKRKSELSGVRGPGRPENDGSEHLLRVWTSGSPKKPLWHHSWTNIRSLFPGVWCGEGCGNPGNLWGTVVNRGSFFEEIYGHFEL